MIEPHGHAIPYRTLKPHIRVRLNPWVGYS